MSWNMTANLRGPAGAPGASGTGAGANAVTIDTTQTVTGSKDFTGDLTLHGASVVTTVDNRLSDQRTPSDGSVTLAKIVSGGLDPSAITGTAITSFDSRLTNARTPTAHASTHGSGGVDAITIAESQVTNLTTDLAAKYSSANKVPMSGLSATGTAGTTTFLRGDGQWIAPTFTAPSNMLTTDTTQTVTGNKTFSNQQIFSSAIRADGGVMSAGAVTATTFVASSFLPSASATSVLQYTKVQALNTALSTNTRYSSSPLSFERTYWNGTTSVSETASVQLVGRTATANDAYLQTPELVALGNVIATAFVYENGNTLAANRVFSPGNKVPVSGLSTTGTAGATTFLRGDGAWASNVLWNDSSVGNQTATSAITFSGGIAFSLASGYAINQTGVSATSNFLGQATFQNNVWVSGSNSQLILDRVAAASAGTVAQPSVNLTFNGSYYSGGATAVSASLNFIPTSTSTGRLSTAVALMASGGLYDGGNRVYSGANLVPVAGLSATGTKDATTFLRGDGTWALPPAAPVTSVAGRTGAVVLGPTDITGTAVITTDSRLSDTRTPTDLTVTTAKIASAGLAPTAITGTAVITTDTRLTNARTPTTHAATHALGGADALTLDESQVTNLVTDLAAKYSPTNTPPGASVGRPYLARTIGTDQSIALNADAVVQFDTLAEDYAVGSGATAIITYSAGVFTATRTGLYVISSTVRFSAAANGERYMAIGSSVQATYAANRWASSGQPGSVACPSTLSCTAMRYLTAGTTFSVWCFQSSGAALTIQTGFASTRAEITYLG